MLHEKELLTLVEELLELDVPSRAYFQMLCTFGFIIFEILEGMFTSALDIHIKPINGFSLLEKTPASSPTSPGPQFSVISLEK
jgi:hypothetical protein